MQWEAVMVVMWVSSQGESPGTDLTKTVPDYIYLSHQALLEPE